MDKVIKLIEMLTAINDPATQMFIALVAVLSVCSLALYVAVLALKRGSKS